VTTVVVFGVTIVVLAIVIVAGRRLFRRAVEGSAGALDGLVVDALADDWSARVAADHVDVRQAMLTGKPAELAERLRSLVRGVALSFERDRVDRSAVQVVVRCEYQHDGRSFQREFAIPWDEVPPDVRADLLRGGGSVVREWKPS
jgi:hypothetical protein